MGVGICQYFIVYNDRDDCIINEVVGHDINDNSYIIIWKILITY